MTKGSIPALYLGIASLLALTGPFFWGNVGWAADRLTQSMNAPCSPNCEELLAKAKRQGEISLTVRLKLPVEVKDRSVDSSRRSQAIKTAQDQLLAAIGKYNVKSVRRLKNKPTVFLRADEAALRALIAYPDIEYIAEAPSGGLASLQRN